METSSNSNERTPLLENDVTSYQQAPPFGEGTSDTKPPITSSPGTLERATNEVSLEEVVQALSSASHRHGPYKELEQEPELEVFTTKQIYAMYVAWKNVTRERQCSSEPHIIGEAVATAIAHHLYPQCGNHTNSLIYYTSLKSKIAAHFLDNWFWITDDEQCHLFPARYVESIFEDSGEQPVAVSEFGLRMVELYDKIKDFILMPKLQVFLHTLLIIWPIFILIIGSKYMECPMGHHLSYLLMVLGVIGCLASLGRLMMMYLSALNGYWLWEWRFQKLMEFTFLIVFVVQAVHFFSVDPTTEADPEQCVMNFYSAALVTNYVSIAFVSAYVLVYFIIICLNLFNFWRWILRRR